VAVHIIGIRFFIYFFNITPEGLHFCEIWTNIGRATLGRNFDVTNGRAACEACSATWNSGYHLSICSRIEENHGKPWSSWPVAGPSGCKLTSSQQPGFKKANPNVCAYLCSCWRCGQNAETLYIFLYKNSVRTSQETYYVSTTKPNRLMLFREIIAVYCGNHTEHINTLCGQNADFSSYLTGNSPSPLQRAPS
jgi:hypothetical protein